MNLIKNIYVLIQAVPVTIVEFFNPEIGPEVSQENEINANELSAYANLFQIENPEMTVYAEKSTYTQNGKAIPCIKFSASETPPYQPANFKTQFILQPQGELARNFNEDEELTPLLGCTEDNDYTLQNNSVPGVATFKLPQMYLNGLNDPFSDYIFEVSAGQIFFGLVSLELNVYEIILIQMEALEENNTVTVTARPYAEFTNDSAVTRFFATNITTQAIAALNMPLGTAGYRLPVSTADEVTLYVNEPDLVNEKQFIQRDSSNSILGTSTMPVEALDWTFDVIEGCVSIQIIDSAP